MELLSFKVAQRPCFKQSKKPLLFNPVRCTDIILVLRRLRLENLGSKPPLPTQRKPVLEKWDNLKNLISS